MKERVTILGKTTPVFDESLKDGLICTTGINSNGEFRRLYPVSIDQYKIFRNWTILDIELLDRDVKNPFKHHRDYRPESRIINYNVENPIKIIRQVRSPKVRFNIIKSVIKPSEDWIKKQINPKMTIGIIRPKIIEIKVTPSTQEVKKPKHPEYSSILEYTNPEVKENSKIKRHLEKLIREYSTRVVDIRFKYKCFYNKECKTHTKQVLDDGLHQFTKKLAKELPIDEVIERTNDNIMASHRVSWIFLGIGTLNRYPSKYTIGSVFRLPKSKISDIEIENIFKSKQATLAEFLTQ